VFYLPRADQAQPSSAAGSLAAPLGHRPTEFSIATGAYAGTEGDQLVLDHPVWRATTHHEAYEPSAPAPPETTRSTVPLEQVNLIRTKPSSTPAVVGTVVGVALDVAAVVLWARAARNID